MRALLDDVTVGDDGDLVGIFDGGETVSDHDGGSALAELVQCLLDHDLGGVVKRTGRLVQNEDRRVLEEHTRDAKTLFLTARQTHAALADDSIVALLHRHDVIMDVGALGGFDDLVLGSVESAIEDVVTDAGVKEVDVLLYDADIAAKRLQRDVVDVLAVDQKNSRLHVVKMRDQMADGGLSAAAGTDQSQSLALLDLEIDVFEDVAVIAIGVGHVAEFDLTPHAFHVNRALCVLLGLDIHHFYESLKACRTALELLHKADQRVDGIQEDIDGNDESRVVGKGDLAVVKEQTACDQNHHVENIGDKGGGGMELPHCLVCLALCLLDLLVADLKFFGFLCCICKRLGHANARNTAFHRRVDDRRGLAALAERTLHTVAREDRDHDEKRYAGENNEREPEVDRGEVGKRNDDRDAADDDIFGAVVRKLDNVKEIVCQPRHDLSRFVLVIEAEGELFEVVEHIAAHLRLHPHAHHMSLILDKVVEHHAHEIEQKESQTEDDDHAVVAVGDEVVEHGARDHRIDHADQSHGQRGKHIHCKQLFMRLVIA